MFTVYISKYIEINEHNWKNNKGCYIPQIHIFGHLRGNKKHDRDVLLHLSNVAI